MEEVKYLITQNDYDRFQELQRAFDENKIVITVEDYYTGFLGSILMKRVSAVGADELAEEFKTRQGVLMNKIFKVTKERNEAQRLYDEIKARKWWRLKL